jgi:hypothetical protein
MKHTLFRRSPLLAIVSILVVLAIAVPACMAAGATGAAVSDMDITAVLGGAVGLMALGSMTTGTPPTVEEALAAAENKTLPMGQRFEMMVNSLRGIDPTGQLANVKAELVTARTDLQARDGELETLRARLAELEQQVAAREADVAAADAARVAAETRSAELESAEQDLTKRAAAMSAEKMKELGFQANELPPATPKEPAASQLDDLRAQFKSEADPEKKGKLHAQIKALEASGAAA